MRGHQRAIFDRILIAASKTRPPDKSLERASGVRKQKTLISSQNRRQQASRRPYHAPNDERFAATRHCLFYIAPVPPSRHVTPSSVQMHIP
jgi:hypothetical protein